MMFFVSHSTFYLQPSLQRRSHLFSIRSQISADSLKSVVFSTTDKVIYYTAELRLRTIAQNLVAEFSFLSPCCAYYGSNVLWQETAHPDVVCDSAAAH
jgi:hypothetical protein